MSDIIDTLSKRERDMISRLALAADCRPEHIASEMVRSYMRLLSEVPDALPRNPLAPLVSNARARSQRAAEGGRP